MLISPALAKVNRLEKYLIFLRAGEVTGWNENFVSGWFSIARREIYSVIEKDT